MKIWFQAFARKEAWTKMAYATAWRNSEGNFWVPYKGHSGTADFLELYKRPEIWFLKDTKEKRP